MIEAPRVIKKYPNRRLYDTRTSCYITLPDVKKLVLDFVDFRVVDARSEEDLTRCILLQIILEEENGGAPLFSGDLLAQIIRFYGHALQDTMGIYLEKNIRMLSEIQHKLQQQQQSCALCDGNSPFDADVWAQFIRTQGPAMQNLMNDYLEQSASFFLEMQQQWQDHNRNLFGDFPPFDSAASSQTPPAGREKSRVYGKK